MKVHGLNEMFHNNIQKLNKSTLFTKSCLLCTYMYTVVDCGDLDDPMNGRVSLDETVFESIATYTCDPGFVLVGNMERICQADGTWSGTEPTCEGQSSKMHYSEHDLTLAIAIIFFFT